MSSIHGVGSVADAGELLGIPVKRLVFRSFVVAGLVNGLSLLGVDSWAKPVVYGSSLVGAMGISAVLRRRLT